MSKTMEAILEKDEQEVRQMAEDMRIFIIEHEAGQHKDGIVPFCEKCEDERNTENGDSDVNYFETAGRDALRSLDSRTSREIYEDDMIDPNPFD